MKVPFLIGRILFGGYFLYNGINHFRNHEPLSQYAGAKKVPAPKASVISSGVALTVGGASVVTGIQPKLGLAAIIGFLGVVSPVMHDFWRNEDPGQRMADVINFTKNLALVGASLALMEIEEPWPASLAPAQPTRAQRLSKLARAGVAAVADRF